MVHLRLLRLWRGHRGALVLLVAVGVAISLTWAAQALLLSQVFAGLLRGSALVDPALLPAVLALGAVLLARPALALTRAAVAHRAMDAVKRDLRSRAFAAMARSREQLRDCNRVAAICARLACVRRFRKLRTANASRQQLE